MWGYVRCGRLVGKAADVYQYLEPLYNDYRKIRRRGVTGCARGSLTVSQGHTTFNAYNTQRASARDTPNAHHAPCSRQRDSA